MRTAKAPAASMNAHDDFRDISNLHAIVKSRPRHGMVLLRDIVNLGDAMITGPYSAWN